MNGIIVIDKPQHMTSHDVVSILRRKTGVRRIGHTGTLDPMATGVLPVFIGKATRLIEYAGQPDDPEAKIYRCTMQLGLETDTLDIWGTQLAAHSVRPASAEIKQALESFEGPGVQIPPMYSAVKVGGRKLYEYARKGTQIDEGLIKERNIYIKHIYVSSIDPIAGQVVFDVHCSKGVYIRTLCADAGRLLGCGAVLSGLIRLQSDGFRIENATPLEALRENDRPLPPLLPMDTPLSWLPRADVDADGAHRFAQGQNVMPLRSADSVDASELDAKTKNRLVRVYGPEGFLGIGKRLQETLITPEKVLI